MDRAGGLVFSSIASLSVLGVAAARNWVRALTWDWKRGPTPGLVLGSAALLTGQTALLAFNEERVFRGYGFDTLRAELRLPGALIVRALRFAS